MRIKKILIALLPFYLLQSCSSDDSEDILTDPNAIFAEELIIDEPGLFPTKFDFDYHKNQFIVGSGSRSNVGHIDPQTGEYSVFIEDENFATIPEVFMDEEYNRIIVTSGDLGVSANNHGTLTYAYMGVYNLETGEKIAGIDFNNLHKEGAYKMANSISVDENGTIYVADTFAPVIYKIDGETYEASVLVEDQRFESYVVGSPGLLGMIYVDGNLLVSKENEGILFKIPLSNPSELIQIDVPFLESAKGLELLENGNLAVAVGGRGTEYTGVKILSTNDHWNSASVVSSFEISPEEKHPVGLTIASDGELYVINTYFLEIVTGDLDIDFSIVRVPQ